MLHTYVKILGRNTLSKVITRFYMIMTNIVLLFVKHMQTQNNSDHIYTVYGPVLYVTPYF